MTASLFTAYLRNLQPAPSRSRRINTDPHLASGFALRYHRVVFTDPATMTKEQRQWVELSRKLWRCAERIAAQHPGMDASGVYHVLWNLRRPVEERLRRGLTRRAPRTK